MRAIERADSASAGAFGIDTAFELDDRRFRILMRDRLEDSVPRFLADPALAVMDAPLGGGSSEGRVVIPRQGSLPVIDLRFPLERDARDALDQEVDLVVTRDPALLDYVSNRTEFVTLPLPWSRTYVLSETGDGEGGLTDKLSETGRISLAKDAVRASARAAEPPYWWSEARACRPDSARSQGNPSSRVVYRKDDEVARSLAERIVALASTGAGLRAVGLGATEFAMAIEGGLERAYVIGLPRQSLAPCRDASLWPAGAWLVPLIDTRASAIVRKGAPPLTAEWDGTLRIVEP